MKSQLVLVLWCINLCSKLAASIPFHEDSAHLVGAQQASGIPSNVPENSNAHSQLHNLVALGHFNPEHLFPREAGNINERRTQEVEQGDTRQALNRASFASNPQDVNAPVFNQGLPSPYHRGMFQPQVTLNQQPTGQVAQNQQNYRHLAEAPTQLPFLRHNVQTQQNQQDFLRQREEERSNLPPLPTQREQTNVQFNKEHQQEQFNQQHPRQLYEGPSNVELSLIPLNQQLPRPSEIPGNGRGPLEAPISPFGEMPPRQQFQQNIREIGEQPRQQSPGQLYVPSMAQLQRQPSVPLNQPLPRPSFEAPLRPIGEMQPRQQAQEIRQSNQPREVFSTQEVPRQVAAPPGPQVPTQPFENAFMRPVESQLRQQFPALPFINQQRGPENIAGPQSGLNRQQIAANNELRKTMTEGTRPKSRFIVVHTNGSVEYVDQLEPEKYPNYKMVDGQNLAANVQLGNLPFLAQHFQELARPVAPSQNVATSTSQITLANAQGENHTSQSNRATLTQNNGEPIVQKNINEQITQRTINAPVQQSETTAQEKEVNVKSEININKSEYNEATQTQNNGEQTVQKNINEQTTQQTITKPVSQNEPTTEEKEIIIKSEYVPESQTTSQLCEETPAVSVPIETDEIVEEKISVDTLEANPEDIEILLIHSEQKNPQTDTIETTEQSTTYSDLQSNYYEAQEKSQESSESNDEEDIIVSTETYMLLESPLPEQSESNSELNNAHRQTENGQEENESSTESQSQSQNESASNHQAETEDQVTSTESNQSSSSDSKTGSSSQAEESSSSASSQSSNTESQKSSKSESQSQSETNQNDNSGDKQDTKAGQIQDATTNEKHSSSSQTQSETQSQTSELNSSISEETQALPYTWFSSRDPDFLDKLLGKDQVFGVVYFFMVPSDSSENSK